MKKINNLTMFSISGSNTSKPTPKQPTSFHGEYKYKEEREDDPSSSQNNSCMSFFPSSFTTET
jgi:hypothetical protein